MLLTALLQKQRTCKNKIASSRADRKIRTKLAPRETTPATPATDELKRVDGDCDLSGQLENRSQLDVKWDDDVEKVGDDVQGLKFRPRRSEARAKTLKFWFARETGISMIEGHATQPDDQFEPAMEFSFS
jgi:hypothetical protein